MPFPPGLPLENICVGKTLLHARCGPSWQLALDLTDYDLWVVTSGNASLQLAGGECLEVSAGSVMLFRPGDKVTGSHDPDDPLEVYVVHFTATEVRECNLSPVRPGRILHLQRSVVLLEELFECAHNGDTLQERQGSALLTALLCRIWREVHSPPLSESDFRLLALCAAIAREPEKPWSLPVMCREVAMSSTKLNHRFRALMREAPVRFVIRKRLERACAMMEETSLTLDQIAAGCGYSDVYFFSRQFKNYYGTSPARYRRARKNPLTVAAVRG